MRRRDVMKNEEQGAQRTTHNAQSTKHNAQHTTHPFSGLFLEDPTRYVLVISILNASFFSYPRLLGVCLLSPSICPLLFFILVLFHSFFVLFQINSKPINGKYSRQKGD